MSILDRQRHIVAGREQWRVLVIGADGRKRFEYARDPVELMQIEIAALMKTGADPIAAEASGEQTR